MEKQLTQGNALHMDISEKQQKETDLHKSEHKYKRIFEDSIDGLILWDYQYRIVDINLAAEKLYGFSKKQLIGQLIYMPFTSHQKYMQEIMKHIHEVIEAGQCTSTLIFKDMDGKKRHIAYNSKREIVEGLNFTVLVDVTEKVEIEEQLRKSDTLNVIGELAAGIAHEIRNPLTALKGFIQLLEGSITKEHSMYYQVITTELQRIDSIINEFLILSKPQAIRFQEKDINQIMRETVDLLHAQAVLYNIQFVTHYDGNIPLIFCEPNQLKKVFINLIKNAIEVMPSGGNITITIKPIENNRIVISIKDEGTGIPKEKIKKLGEPFYTTKDRGTGLGLMVSYRIINEHNGAINIESEVGKGTTFYVHLPLNLENNSIM